MTADEFADADWPALARYLTGQCSATEQEAVEQWIAAHPARRPEVELLREGSALAALIPPGARAEQVYRRVAGRAGLAVPIAKSAVPQFTFAAPARHGLRRALAIGLPVAAAVALGFATWTHRRPAVPAPPPPAPQQFATQPAQRETIELADGSRVTLGAASRLVVPAEFGAQARTVMLEGEASFAVTPDARRPFRVRTATTMTEDIGTRFLVLARPQDGEVTVGVAEGRVALRPDTAGAGHGVVLSAGQLARVGRNGLVAVAAGADVRALLAWTEGRLEFDKTPLSEVRGAVERWYGVTIRLPDSTFDALPVSASFTGVPVDEALGTLARLLDLRYHRSGSTVRFLIKEAAQPEEAP